MYLGIQAAKIVGESIQNQARWGGVKVGDWRSENSECNGVVQVGIGTENSENKQVVLCNCNQKVPEGYIEERVEE